MFSRTGGSADDVTVTVDGQRVAVSAQDTVAAVLLMHAPADGYRRSVVNGAPRAPYCMIGACFECLVRVNGRFGVRGCQVLVEEGMVIERQMGRTQVLP